MESHGREERSVFQSDILITIILLLWLEMTVMTQKNKRNRQSSPPSLFISIWSRILIKEEKTRTAKKSLYQTLGHLFKRKIVSWGFCSVIPCLLVEHLLKAEEKWMKQEEKPHQQLLNNNRHWGKKEVKWKERNLPLQRIVTQKSSWDKTV